MCGIAGILDNQSKISPDSISIALSSMLNAIKHRGPDDRGEEKILSKKGLNVHLGHQRLSIIDPGPGGHQPMSNNDSSIWISTNSEIYNYKDLKKKLGSKYSFRTNSDTEVLLKSYEAWGIDCLEKLRGMFAFAIYDTKNKKLILARDRLGIKPLYYYSKENLLLFSSELRSILASKIPNQELSSTAIFQYLAFGRIGSPETIINSIKEVPPGHFLIADTNGIKIEKYWDPLKNKIILNRNHPLIEQIGCEIEEAVKLNLESDVSLGAFLSGGIDSSAIVSAITSVRPNRIQTISATFKETKYDESQYSTLISNLFNTHHYNELLVENDILQKLPGALAAMDQPTVDGINTYMISSLAIDKGMKVALSGLGGDELFAGYDSFSIIPKLENIKKVTSALPLFLKNQLGDIVSKYLATSDRNTKLKHYIKEKYNGSHIYFLIRALFCEEELVNIFSNSNIFSKELEKNFNKTQELIASKSDLSSIDLISYLELTQYMAPALLRDTDMMSMAHSLEVRVPLIDHKLVELMFSIPPAIKTHQGSPKRLLVDALKLKLPDSVVNRKKMGFTLPFNDWMKGEMRSEIETVLLSPSDKLSAFISDEGVREIWINFLENRCSWSRPWSLYVLKKWIDINL
jgi:asparagine synthase (glutamine-hydrolysing)